MKTILAWMFLALVLAGGAWLVSHQSTVQQLSAPAATAVLTGDKQVIEVLVKEGYEPREINARAGVPVILKMKTQNTLDCSTSFSIPQLGIRAQLETTGEAVIEIPAQKAGDTLHGVCSMGMYSLVINFT